jgi:hypothetical protein
MGAKLRAQRAMGEAPRASKPASHLLTMMMAVTFSSVEVLRPAVPCKLNPCSNQSINQLKD